MPIEEKLAEFLEAYEYQLSQLRERFRPLRAEARRFGGDDLPADLRRRTEMAWSYFATRMANVPIPPDAAAEKLENEHPLVLKLEYAESFTLTFEYFDPGSEMGGYDSLNRLVSSRRIPGLTLNERIELTFSKPRQADWRFEESPERGKGFGWNMFFESDAGVIEVAQKTYGGFWSTKELWAAADPKIEVWVGRLPLTFRGSFRELYGITNAQFSKRDVGTGEIDAFLGLVEGLPVLEVYASVR